MVEWWQALILALIQGVTEFLPISSSAHLILPSEILGWDDQGLAFDVAVHLGSLIAVVLYFRSQVTEIAIGGVQSVTGKWTEQGRMAWLLVLATIPASLAGLVFDDYIESNLRSSLVIAITTLIGAFLLAIADRVSASEKIKGKELADITWKLALVIGVAQATALIPGTSRSGITMTVALLLGFHRISAAQFSFLMSIPIICLSAVWKAIGLLGVASVAWTEMFIGMLISGLSAYLCIKYFMHIIERIGFMPFVIYRLLLGIVLILLFV